MSNNNVVKNNEVTSETSAVWDNHISFLILQMDSL